MATLDSQVAAALDDAYENVATGAVSVTGHVVLWVRTTTGTRYHSAVRFTTGSFPPMGSTITAAYIEVYVPNTTNDDAAFDIYAEKVASPATFAATSFNITSRTLTTASVAWDANGLLVGWKTSPSIVSVIQELVDSYTPTAIVISLKPRNALPAKTLTPSAYEQTPTGTLGAKLHLEWTSAGAATLTPAAIAVPVDPVAPTVAVGGTTITPTVAGVLLSAQLTHQIVLGTTTLSPAAIAVPIDPVAPTVSTGGVTLAPDPAYMGINAVEPALAPAITLEATTVTLAAVSDSGDGEISGTNATYATARSTATAHNTTATFGDVGQTTGYEVDRTFLKFDTSSIPDDATITEAKLTLVCTDDASNLADFDVQIVKADWSASDPMTAGGREEAYDAILAATLDQVWRNTFGIATNTPYTSPALDTTRISKTGFTYYGLRSSRDAAGNVPDGLEIIAIAMANHTTAAYRPKLSITYTVPVLAVGISPVAPTISVGATTLTPSPAVAPFVVPTQTLIATGAGTTLSPAPVVVPIDPVAPTVATGAVTLSPAAVAVPIDPVAPTLTLEKALTPAAVVVPIDPVAPTLVLAITLTPAPVVVPVDPVAPTLVLAVTITAPVASTSFTVLAVNTIVKGPVTLTPAAVAMAMEVPLHVIVGTGADALVAFGKITRLIDPRDYPDSALFYFEAVILTGDGAHPCRARLYNVTDGAVVSSSEVTTTATTATRVRSSALTLAAASKEYRADFGGIAGGTFKCFAADVLVEVNA